MTLTLWLIIWFLSWFVFWLLCSRRCRTGCSRVLLIFFIIKYIPFLGFSTVNLLQKIITIFICPLFAIFIFFMNGYIDSPILQWIKWWKIIRWRLGSTVKNPSFGTSIIYSTLHPFHPFRFFVKSFF